MIALITARGGSKRLPRKNVLSLDGKPLIAHTVEAALAASSITRVVVSTDDQEIADIATEYGAEVPFMRPPSLASDTATSSDVVLHAIDFFGQEEFVEEFCLLQPTSPLRSAEDIDAACDLFRRKKAASVVSVSEYDHPVQWALTLGSEDEIHPLYEDMPAMTQEADVYYRPNGAIYVFESAFFRRTSSYFSERSFAYPMPRERSVDIDTRLDFLIAEAIINYLKADDHVE